MEGWKWLYETNKNHYFVDGKSLCKRWLTMGVTFNRFEDQEDCKSCQKNLEKRKFDT